MNSLASTTWWVVLYTKDNDTNTDNATWLHKLSWPQVMLADAQSAKRPEWMYRGFPSAMDKWLFQEHLLSTTVPTHTAMPPSRCSVSQETLQWMCRAVCPSVTHEWPFKTTFSVKLSYWLHEFCLPGDSPLSLMNSLFKTILWVKLTQRLDQAHLPEDLKNDCLSLCLSVSLSIYRYIIYLYLHNANYIWSYTYYILCFSSLLTQAFLLHCVTLIWGGAIPPRSIPWEVYSSASHIFSAVNLKSYAFTAIHPSYPTSQTGSTVVWHIPIVHMFFSVHLSHRNDCTHPSLFISWQPI